MVVKELAIYNIQLSTGTSEGVVDKPVTWCCGTAPTR